MIKKNSAAAFLENMKQETVENVPSPGAHERTTQSKRKSPAATRQGLKHIGGYFDTALDEKFAVLRARLQLDNSQLIELAINELYNKQKAKRAFNE